MYGMDAQESGYGGGHDSYNHEPPHPYNFGYDIKDHHGNTQFHKEDGDEYGAKKGSYGFTDAYGVYRTVEYVADHNGFRAWVKTNEPGTANQDPADAKFYASPSPYMPAPYRAPSYGHEESSDHGYMY